MINDFLRRSQGLVFMGILSWIVLGLVAGIIAKLLLPGGDPSGWIVTTLIGVAGAFICGWLGTQFGFGGFTGFDVRGLVTATVGALVLLIGLRLISGRK
jgi:uncharacterized membrane protein YeaQ/YmgE (transglycosylase-associated protein family)